MVLIFGERSWIELPISILPNVIGFSLGGYAIWLALGDSRFRESISGSNSKGQDSPFIKVNAAFIHFIILQILALVVAIVAKAEPIVNSPTKWQTALLNVAPWLFELAEVIKLLGWFIGYLLFIYAILSAVAATMALFRIAKWLDVYQSNKKDSSDN